MCGGCAVVVEVVVCGVSESNTSWNQSRLAFANLGFVPQAIGTPEGTMFHRKPMKLPWPEAVSPHQGFGGACPVPLVSIWSWEVSGAGRAQVLEILGLDRWRVPSSGLSLFSSSQTSGWFDRGRVSFVGVNVFPATMCAFVTHMHTHTTP